MEHDGDLDESERAEKTSQHDDDTANSSSNKEGNEEERRKEKERQDRIEASLRERNKEVKKIKDEYNSEREKERDMLRHDEAVDSFKVCLKFFCFTFFKGSKFNKKK